uniref:Uncharacterized protein n=1 Tax=Anopheles quadriannulatus TaxID=34691 RepID=A0A182XSD5_ANOQN
MAADFDSEMGSKNKKRKLKKKTTHGALKVECTILHIPYTRGSNSYAFNLFICNFLINTYYGIITIGGCFLLIFLLCLRAIHMISTVCVRCYSVFFSSYYCVFYCLVLAVSFTTHNECCFKYISYFFAF